MPDFDGDDTDMLERQVEGITQTLDDLDLVLRYASAMKYALKVEWEEENGKVWWCAHFQDPKGEPVFHGEAEGETPVAAVAALASVLIVEEEE